MAAGVDVNDAIPIDNHDVLFRWVHKHYADLKEDGALKKLKPGAFSLKATDDHGFSLFLEKLMKIDRCKRRAKDSSPNYVGIVSLLGVDFRETGVDVEQRVEDGEIAHCEVVGYKSLTDDQITDLKRELAKRSSPSWVPLI